jgi:hypothetical protein
MTVQELFHALISMPDLHSHPQLQGDILVWNLYKTAHVLVCCRNGDISVSVESNSLFRGTLHRWHPGEEDLLQELYTLGKKGNILVIKQTFLSTEPFYCGPAGDYPQADRKSWHFGRKKYDSGQLIYLEQLD